MWIIYPLLFLTGFVDSIAGGGGLISLSSFLAVGVPPHLALGTNKVSAFLGTGLSAAYFARQGHVNWRAALYAFTGAVAGSALGARLALLVDERTLSLVLMIAIPLIAVFLITKKDLGTVEKHLSKNREILYALLVGLLVGCYDGFIGPGTGTFLIIAFTLFMGQNLLTACGNAKIVNFASNIAAAGMFMYSGSVDYKLAIPCAGCAILGNYVGTKLALKNGAKIVRPMMVVVVLLLLAKVAKDFFTGAG